MGMEIVKNQGKNVRIGQIMKSLNILRIVNFFLNVKSYKNM